VVDPPSRSQETRPLLQRYVIWLLHHHLTKNTVEKVIKQLRKLHWDDAELREWVHRALIDCASVKYHIIHLVACVISGLARCE
jgi:regulator of nonsense transcripts 2